MNKLAAEKIAQEYYTLGAQLALEKIATNLKLMTSLANNVSKQIGQAGKLTSGAGAIRRFSGHIPGTQMNKAQKVLRGASGNVNRSLVKDLTKAPPPPVKTQKQRMIEKLRADAAARKANRASVRFQQRRAIEQEEVADAIRARENYADFIRRTSR